jgi:hypothetical protein
MKGRHGQKPVAAETVHGLHLIEHFGPLLGISDNVGLQKWQALPRYTIFVEARERGRYDVRYQDQNENVLIISRQPLLDCARLFMSLGANPRAIIAMRRRGKDRDDLYGPIVVAAKLTVDETKTIFASWKPFPQSAVQATEASANAPATRVANNVDSG